MFNYIQIKSSSGIIRYLLQDILIAFPAEQRGEDEHIHTPVAKRPQSAVILLTCIQGQAESMIRRRKRKKNTWVVISITELPQSPVI